MSPSTLHTVVWGMAVGRVLIGLGPFVAAGRLSKMLGFPDAHDNPSARVMARLFGVRDIGLGVLAAWAASDLARLHFIMLFQAFMDAGDLVSALIPILKKQGINRGAVSTGLFALGGASAWITLFLMVSP